MLIDRVGASMEIEGKTFTIGGLVQANNQSEYEGLQGEVFEIRSEADKETENEGVDIYCSFFTPDDPALVAELEAVFSDLYRMPKKLEDISLDYAIMCAEMLEVVTQ